MDDTLDGRLFPHTVLEPTAVAAHSSSPTNTFMASSCPPAPHTHNTVSGLNQRAKACPQLNSMDAYKHVPTTQPTPAHVRADNHTPSTDLHTYAHQYMHPTRHGSQLTVHHLRIPQSAITNTEPTSGTDMDAPGTAN